MYSLGIDFGNSYVSVGVCKDGEPGMLLLGEENEMIYNPYVYPVAAYLETNTKLLLGYEAELMKYRMPYRYRNNFKNNLGNHVPFLVDQDEVSVEILCRSILRKVYDIALKEYGNDITHTVLTYSNSTSLYRRKLLEKTARLAGIANIQMISDADAAISYECYKNQHFMGNVFMVCDIGGTSFNLSLKVYTKEGYRDLIPPILVNDCGGCNFTRKIFDDVVMKNAGKYENALSNQKYNLIKKFEQIAENAKIHLDTNTQYKIETVVDDVYIKYELSREDYHNLISEYVTSIEKVITYAIRRACIDENDISSLIFVGGSSKTPYIVDRICTLLHQSYPTDRYPEMAPCIGAAISVSDTMASVKEFVKNDYKEAIVPGSYIILGSYNGENLIWKVMYKSEEGIAVVSQKSICFKAYASMEDSAEYGKGALLTWLNSPDNTVHYEFPPTEEAVWYNAYEKEKGFLTSFDELGRRVIGNYKIGLPDRNLISYFGETDMCCYPTQAAVQQNEGTFGEDYSSDQCCPYWITGDDEFNMINSKGEKDISVRHNGTIGVRPVMFLGTNTYATGGEGTKDNPYRIIC